MDKKALNIEGQLLNTAQLAWVESREIKVRNAFQFLNINN